VSLRGVSLRGVSGLAAGSLLVSASVLLASCGIKPDRVEAVVTFTPDVTAQQQEAVRTACPSVGHALQEPPDRNDLQSSRRYPLRYDVTRASAQDKSALYRCLNGRPGVRGVNEESDGG